MAIHSYYLKEHRFALNIFTGELDDKSLMKLINDVNKVAENVPDLRSLSDARELQSIDNLSVEGTIGSSKVEINRPQSLLAILIPEFNQQIYGMVKVYQSFSEGNRKAVEIFTDLNEALSWLARDEQDKEVLRDFIKNSSSNPNSDSAI